MSTFGKVGARPLLLKNTGEYAEEQMYKELFKATVERSGSTTLDLVSDTLTSIGYYAFTTCTFRNVYLPNVTTMGERCFYNGHIYGNIYMPKLKTTPRPHAFGQCGFMGGTITLPVLQYIGNNMFYNSFSRTNTQQTPTYVEAPMATSVSGGAFYNDSGLRRLYAPRVTSITSGFTSVGRRYCGDNKNIPADECALIVGSAELDTGMTMDGLVSSSGFPFGAAADEYAPTWYCKDGTVTYDTSTSSWVQNPYT